MAADRGKPALDLTRRRRNFRRWAIRWLVATACFALGCGEARAAWLKVTLPELTLMADLPSETARRWMVALEESRQAIRQVLPLGEDPVPPPTVVLLRNEDALYRFKPRDESGVHTFVGAYFVRNRWLIAGSSGGRARDAQRRVIHELVHWHLAALPERPPLWLEEGLAEVLCTIDVGRTRARVGRPVPDHYFGLKKFGVRPLGDLLSRSDAGLQFADRELPNNRAFYAHAWLLTHYLWLGAEPGGDARVRRLLDLPRQTASAATHLEAATGLKVAELEPKLRDYARRPRFPNVQKPIARAERINPQIEPATDSEVQAVLGNLLMSLGRWEDAAEHFSAAERLDPQNGAAQVGLGEIALAQQRVGEALERFERGATLGAESSFSCLMRAEHQLGDGQADPRRLLPTDATAAAALLHRAAQLDPHLVRAYERLGYLALTLPSPTAADAALL
ncbi:MAG TPA: tetratricopeptide repeat protein, partial [Candidatus Synoicihabitans sp.]|nr:tetratricopeptide repeat protein [Candidatus Synoicihabitans sp.]